jgi:Cu-processing system permease protein
MLTLLTARDLRGTVRDRWLYVYALSFAALGILVAWGGAAASSITGTSGFGPIVAQFVMLIMLFAPLMGLSLGAQTIVRDRERGITGSLLSQPIARNEYFASKALSLAIALCASMLFGFAAISLVMAALRMSGGLGDLAALLGLAWTLALAMAAVGMLVSVIARKPPTALGAAIALWLAFTVFGDLGLMATAMVTHLGIAPLLYATLLNPVEAFKIAAVAQLSGSLDVLGPGGRLATDVFGGALLPVTVAAICLWAAVPICSAWSIFRKQDAV